MNRKLTFAIALTMLTGIMLTFPHSALAVVYEVEIEDFSFMPGRLHINPGDGIEWRNRDNVMHSATSDNGIWDSGLLALDQTFTFIFNNEGIYPYHCTPHPYMVDTIVVGTPTGIGDESPSIPSQFELSQNYPNPFNTQTEISYALPNPSHVRIAIYNLLGQKVETLIDQDQAAGEYRVLWDGSGASSGVYFYRLEAGNYAQSRRMVLLK